MKDKRDKNADEFLKPQAKRQLYIYMKNDVRYWLGNWWVFLWVGYLADWSIINALLKSEASTGWNYKFRS